MGSEPGVDDVPSVAEEEDHPRPAKQRHQEIGDVGAGLLDDHQRVGAGRDPGVAGLGVEPGDNQLAQRGPPYVAVTVREEVAGLLALDLVEDGELRVRTRGRPRERDRPPDAEVVAEVWIVDRNGAFQFREHPQEPGAAAARRAEDPEQSVLAPLEAEGAVSRWPLHVSTAGVQRRLRGSQASRRAPRTPASPPRRLRPPAGRGARPGGGPPSRRRTRGSRARCARSPAHH